MFWPASRISCPVLLSFISVVFASEVVTLVNRFGPHVKTVVSAEEKVQNRKWKHTDINFNCLPFCSGLPETCSVSKYQTRLIIHFVIQCYWTALNYQIGQDPIDLSVFFLIFLASRSIVTQGRLTLRTNMASCPECPPRMHGLIQNTTVYSHSHFRLYIKSSLMWAYLMHWIELLKSTRADLFSSGWQFCVSAKRRRIPLAETHR